MFYIYMKFPAISLRDVTWVELFEQRSSADFIFFFVSLPYIRGTSETIAQILKILILKCSSRFVSYSDIERFQYPCNSLRSTPNVWQ